MLSQEQFIQDLIQEINNELSKAIPSWSLPQLYNLIQSESPLKTLLQETLSAFDSISETSFKQYADYLRNKEPESYTNFEELCANLYPQQKPFFGEEKQMLCKTVLKKELKEKLINLHYDISLVFDLRALSEFSLSYKPQACFDIYNRTFSRKIDQLFGLPSSTYFKNAIIAKIKYPYSVAMISTTINDYYHDIDSLNGYNASVNGGNSAQEFSQSPQVEIRIKLMEALKAKIFEREDFLQVAETQIDKISTLFSLIKLEELAKKDFELNTNTQNCIDEFIENANQHLEEYVLVERTAPTLGR